MIVFIKNIVLRNFEEYLKNKDYLFLEHRKIIFLFLHVTTSKDRCLTKITCKRSMM